MDRAFVLLTVLALLLGTAVALWPNTGADQVQEAMLIDATAEPAEHSGAPGASLPSVPELNPDPSFSPGKVIKLIVDALRKNDAPDRDSGLATAYRFCSPANRKANGSFDNFTRNVKSATYAPLLNHPRAAYGRIIRDARQPVAQQAVWILDQADNVLAVYTFTVSKQENGEYKDCWMTEAVRREVRPRPRRRPRRPNEQDESPDKRDDGQVAQVWMRWPTDHNAPSLA
jgi:hypothetical protein